MAYPTIRSNISYKETSSANYHPVLFTGLAREDEWIFGVISGYYTGTITKHSGSSANFQISSTYSGTDDVRLCFFAAKALGGSQDYLAVTTTQARKLSIVYYFIQGHNCDDVSDMDGEWNWGATGGFITPDCPNPNDYVSDDYLWLNFVAYQDGVCTTLNAPSGFSNVVHVTREDSYEVSAASCDRQYTGSQITSSTWINSPSAYPYIVLTVRIPSGSYGVGEPGFGIIKPPSIVTNII